jgi:CBS domain-containing membrane protein
MRKIPLRRLLGLELVAVNAGERFVAAAGGGLAMFLLAAFSFAALPHCGAAAVVASMGASAVLLFAAPHGPLSQPWPLLAGHGVSALLGVVCARFIEHPYLASACAVGLAIGAMHLLRCIHPPGGATAFTAVMGGRAVEELGFSFVLFPVLTNAFAILLLAVALNAPFRWRRYPAILSRPPRAKDLGEAEPEKGPRDEDILAALRSVNSFIDVSEEDLRHLVAALAPSARPRPDHKSAKEGRVPALPAREASTTLSKD